MDTHLHISYLAEHPEAVPMLKQWFETEWTDYYGPAGPGDAEQDLIAYSSREKFIMYPENWAVYDGAMEIKPLMV